MNKTFNILGYQAVIAGLEGSYFLMFVPGHRTICTNIANHFNIPTPWYGKPNWNYLLIKLYPFTKSKYENSSGCFSPLFDTMKQVEYFALSLQTELLINIV